MVNSPLIRPAISWGGIVAFGGSGPLDCHVGREVKLTDSSGIGLGLRASPVFHDVNGGKEPSNKKPTVFGGCVKSLSL